jgi:predicted  nucleic acid-binding Zn-ribbon protein
VILDNPLAILKRELDSIRSVVTEIDGNVTKLNDQITELMTQKASLNLVATAIDNEMDRIRTAPQQLEQLELDLELE